MKESKTVNNILCQLLLLLVIIFLLSLNNLHSASWFNEDWTYRKKVNITGQAGAGDSYQILLKVGESSNSDTYVFHLENNSDSFPTEHNQSGDIRFTAADGVTLLNIWVERVNGDEPNRTAFIWVQALSLEADTYLYCYYGNVNAENVSNGDSTFIFYEDFESYASIVDGNIPTGWENYSSGRVELATDNGNRVLLKTANSDPNGGFVNFGYTFTNFEIAFNTKRINFNNGSQNRYSVSNNLAYGYGPRITNFNGASTQMTIERRDAGNPHSDVGSGTVVSDSNVWYKFLFRKYFDTMVFELYDDTGNLIQTVSGNDTTHTDTEFTRFYIHGGWDYYTDNIRIREYVDPEPTFDTSGVEQKNTDISINYPPIESYDTNVINITVSGTVVNYYEGDTVEIFVGDNDNPQDTVILSGVGTDTNWVLNITLLKPSDSITVRLTDINGNQYFDTITITKEPPDIPTGIDATAILNGSDTGVLLSWSHNTDPDTAGYNIYRTSDPSDFSDTINIDLITDTNYFLDTTVVQGETYFYKITCVDKVGNESPQSDSITASSVKIKLSVDTYGRTLPGDTLTLYFNYYNDGFGPAYGANLFYNIPNNLIFDTFVPNVNNVSDTYIESLQRLQWKFNSPILPKLESDSKNLGVILKIK